MSRCDGTPGMISGILSVMSLSLAVGCVGSKMFGLQGVLNTGSRKSELSSHRQGQR